MKTLYAKVVTLDGGYEYEEEKRVGRKDGNGENIVVIEKYKKLEDEYQLFYESLREKYNVNSTEDLKKQLSEDDRKILHDFSERFEKLESIKCEEEIFYWRKPYNLHAFITSNFLPLGEDDNCNHILLTKENIKLIIDKLKNDPSYFNCDMCRGYSYSNGIVFLCRL